MLFDAGEQTASQELTTSLVKIDMNTNECQTLIAFLCPPAKFTEETTRTQVNIYLILERDITVKLHDCRTHRQTNTVSRQRTHVNRQHGYEHLQPVRNALPYHSSSQFQK